MVRRKPYLKRKNLKQIWREVHALERINAEGHFAWELTGALRALSWVLGIHATPSRSIRHGIKSKKAHAARLKKQQPRCRITDRNGYWHCFTHKVQWPRDAGVGGDTMCAPRHCPVESPENYESLVEI